MKKLTKSAAIRKVLRIDPSESTNTIRDIVRETYGLEVSNSHISNLVGPYKERVRKGPAGRSRLEQAGKFLEVCGGSLREAVQLIHTIEEQRETERNQ